MRLDTDSADLRARLAEVERERDATQRENAELRRRLAEMMEQASQPRGTYRERRRPLDETDLGRGHFLSGLRRPRPIGSED